MSTMPPNVETTAPSPTVNAPITIIPTTTTTVNNNSSIESNTQLTAWIELAKQEQTTFFELLAAFPLKNNSSADPGPPEEEEEDDDDEDYEGFLGVVRFIRHLIVNVRHRSQTRYYEGSINYRFRLY